MAEKFYHICGRAYDDDGKMHIVTVVGKVKQGSEKVDVKLDANEIPILVNKKHPPTGGCFLYQSFSDSVSSRPTP